MKYLYKRSRNGKFQRIKLAFIDGVNIFFQLDSAIYKTGTQCNETVLVPSHTSQNQMDCAFQ